MTTDKRWELTKNEKIRADSAHNVRVALERMDCHIERGMGLWSTGFTTDT